MFIHDFPYRGSEVYFVALSRLIASLRFYNQKCVHCNVCIGHIRQHCNQLYWEINFKFQFRLAG